MISNPGGERSEPLVSLDTVKDKYDNPGAGIWSACPRNGSVVLESWKGNVAFVNTNCMSWRCVGCRDRIKARFRGLVTTGVSTLGRCAFMTITYQADSPRLEDAECVRKDWQALLRRLKSTTPWVSQMEWLRVMELTKRGIPHHHLVMGPVPSEKRIGCWAGKLTARWFLSRRDCPCLAHVVSLAWERVTGDSWVVHTVPVTSAKRAGGYMGKYMGKEFDGERAEALGMARRWSNSRGWPGERRNRLALSKAAGGPGFRRAVYGPGQVDDELLALSSAEVLVRQRADTDRETKQEARKLIKVIGGVVHA